MDVTSILTELYSELRRVDQAIVALQRLSSFRMERLITASKSPAGASPEALNTQAKQRFVGLVGDSLARTS